MSKGVIMLRVGAAVLLATAALAALPSWPATYNMSMSTVFMPCNYSGYFDPAYAARWGLVDFDWCVALVSWLVGGLVGARKEG